MQQAIETAQTRLQQSLQGTTLQQAEQNLQNWAKMNRDQVDYEKNNGTVTKNQAGKLIFTGQSAIWFSNLLTELKLQTEGDIKWSNFQERHAEQRQAAMDYIHAYSRQQVTYKGTQRWIYDPLVMVEEYQAGDFDYRVNIENGLIVEIEPIQDSGYANISTPEWKPAEDRAKTEEIIQRLAPKIDLTKLTFVPDFSPGYYRWEDRTVDRLPSGQFRCVQVVFGPDDKFATFLNSLSPAP